MTLFHVPLPILHVGQRGIVGLPGKRKIGRCGRRFGKTDVGKTLAVDEAAKGFPVGWFAPDYKISSEAYDEMLDVIESSTPSLKRSASKVEGRIKTRTKGRIDVWTLENERAGRSRKYKRVIIDEAGFTKAGPNTAAGSMLGIWERAIEPTLLDLDGDVFVLSNTNGNDPENFLYAISPAGGDPPLGGYDPRTYAKNPRPGAKYGFTEYHAPSWTNPHVPARKPGENREDWLVRRAVTFEKLRREKHPLVFAQEYGAEFVDWSGVAFFGLDKLLANGLPVDWPTNCDAVFAVIDSATKTGQAHDGTGVVYFAVNKSNPFYPLTVLDWDLVQIEGAFLIDWLPGVLARLEVLAGQVGARSGSLGAMIEDKNSGSTLLQSAARKQLPATAIPSDLTALGKDERAIKASDHVYPGRVKVSRHAFDKVTDFKGTTRNHFLAQVTGFRIGDKDAAKRADDLLDGFAYGVTLGLGDPDGL